MDRVKEKIKIRQGKPVGIGLINMIMNDFQPIKTSKIVLRLFLIHLFILVTQSTASINTESRDQNKIDSMLFEMSKNSILKYGPSYYRDNSITNITKVKLFDEGDFYGLNANRTFYIVTSKPGTNKENLEFNFLSKLKVWADNLKPFEIGFGDGSAIIFTEQINPLDIKDSAKRNIYLQTQKFRIPYGSSTKQINYQTSEPRKFISAKWDTTFIQNIQNYAKNKQMAKSIYADLEANASGIKTLWINGQFNNTNNIDLRINKYISAYTQDKDKLNLSLSCAENYILDSLSFQNLEEKDSVEYYLKVIPDKASGYIYLSGKILYLMQLSSISGHWIPDATTPIFGVLSDLLSDLFLNKGFKIFTVFVELPEKYSTKQIPFFVYKGKKNVLMSFTDDYKSTPLKTILLNLKHDIEINNREK